MRWVITHHIERDYLHVVVSGAFHLDQHRRMVKDILNHPAWQPGMRTLFDDTAATWDSASYSAMLEVVQIHRQHDAEIGNGRSAIVMTPGVAFGQGRQFQLLGEGHISATVQIFTETEAALAWLMSDEADPS